MIDNSILINLSNSELQDHSNIFNIDYTMLNGNYFEKRPICDCQNLTSFDFNDSFEYLPEIEFINHKNVKSLKLGKKFSSIDYSLINNFSELQNINAKATNIDTIEEAIFSHHKSLSCFEFPNALKDIKFSSFRGCNKIKEIDLRNTQTSAIGNKAFEDDCKVIRK